MEVSVENEGQICSVVVQDSRIDAAVALAFKEAMRGVTQDAGNTVVLDLEQVTFIDSSGLGALVATLKHLAPDRAFVLAGMTPAVQRVFELTRMDTVFQMFTTRADALRAYQG